MENIALLLDCGEALENSIEAMHNLGAPDNLCELVEAQAVLRKLNRLFGLKEGVTFSTLDRSRLVHPGMKGVDAVPSAH